jgi:hypothetical protein
MKNLMLVLFVLLIGCGSETSIDSNEAADVTNEPIQNTPPSSLPPPILPEFKTEEILYKIENNILTLNNPTKGFGHPVRITKESFVVGHPQDQAVYYYNFHELLKITPNENANGFGEELDIGQNIMAVGAHGYNGNGSVYIYEVAGQVKLLQKIEPSVHIRDDYGAKLDLSSSGEYLAVSAYFDDELGDNVGAVYVYKKKGNQFEFETKLLPSNGRAGDNFGFAVSVADNGTIVVGSCNHNTTGIFAGASYIYELNNGQWEEVAVFYGVEEYGFLGDASAINSAGTVVVSAAPYEQNGGAVYFYEKQNGNWNETDRIVSPSMNQYNCQYETRDTSGCNYFGYSVALDDLGDTLLVGASGDGECRAYSYENKHLNESYCLDDLEGSSLGNRVGISPDGIQGLLGDNALNRVLLVDI